MMKRILFGFGFLCLLNFSSKAQAVASGDFANLVDKTNIHVVFDYSKTKFFHTDKSMEELLESKPKFSKIKETQEKYFIGSINDDVKKLLAFGDFRNPDAVLTICVNYMEDDMDNPRLEAKFVDVNNVELLTINNIQQEDLNDAGHLLGKFIYKELKKLKKTK